MRLRAPIIPKKFFHTAGNFREHKTESENVNWSHDIAPWINFFQNVDAIIGPDEPVIYPEHLTEELDYELELAVVLRKPGKWFTPEEAADYIGGYVIFNDLTARDIQRGEMRSGVFSFCKAIDTFCPLGPWIVTPDEIPDPRDLHMELRVNGEVRQESHSGNMSVTIPEILSNFSGARATRQATCSRPGRSPASPGSSHPRSARVALSQAGRRGRGGDRADRRAPQPGRLVAGGSRHASASPRRAARGADGERADRHELAARRSASSSVSARSWPSAGSTRSLSRAPDNVLYLTNFWGMKGYDAVVFPREGEPMLLCLEASADDAARTAWTGDVRLFAGYHPSDPRPPSRALSRARVAAAAGTSASASSCRSARRRRTGWSASRRRSPRRWFDAFPGAVDATPLLSEARAIKTPQEIERMRLANEIAAAAMDHVARGDPRRDDRGAGRRGVGGVRPRRGHGLGRARSSWRSRSR